MQPQQQQPLVVNKSRGIILIVGTIITMITMFVGAFTAQLVWTMKLPDGGAIVEKFTVMGFCVSGIPDGFSGRQAVYNNECYKYECDALHSQMETALAFYGLAGTALCVALVVAICDVCGCINKRIAQVIIYALVPVGALIGFIVVMATYKGTYCDKTISKPPPGVIATVAAGPYVCLCAGAGAIIGIIVTLFVKDRPAPIAAEVPFQPQQVVYVQQPQQGQPQYMQGQQPVQYVQQPQQGQVDQQQCAPVQQQPV